MIKYLSPTSLRVLETDPRRFVLIYVLGTPRPPQTRPMAIGSAFDAFVKAALTKDLLGLDIDLFDSQVEPQNRAWCRENAPGVFESYKQHGAYRSLLKELAGADDVRFEFDAKTDLIFDDGFKVPILGKPDLYAYKAGINLLVDWKVNGFCSQASPHPGYTVLFPTGRAYDPMQLTKTGPFCHSRKPLDKPDWNDQLRIYTWAIERQAHASSVWIVGIDQLAYRFGDLRVAAHRYVLEERHDLRERLRKAWEMVLSGHLFAHVGKEESDNMIADLQALPVRTRALMIT